MEQRRQDYYSDTMKFRALRKQLLYALVKEPFYINSILILSILIESSIYQITVVPMSLSVAEKYISAV